jgi:HEAT repeat protein
LLRQVSVRFALFPGKRPEYLAALRSIVDDPDRTLRRRAVGALAREKDEYVQRRLIDGLEGHEKPLVPTAKAIQLLGNDVHAEFLPVIRRYVEDPPSQSARKEAIRLLAADPTASDLLLSILRDRGENADVRRISAIALHSLAPDVVLEQARRIAVDETEPPELRAWALTTLTHFDDQGAASGDMAGRVAELGEQSSSRQVKKAARAFVSKYAE